MTSLFEFLKLSESLIDMDNKITIYCEACKKERVVSLDSWKEVVKLDSSLWEKKDGMFHYLGGCYFKQVQMMVSR